jgi:hypothetical protein
MGKDFLGGLASIAGFIGLLITKTEEWYEATGKNDLLTVFFALGGCFRECL